MNVSINSITFVINDEYPHLLDVVSLRMEMTSQTTTFPSPVPIQREELKGSKHVIRLGFNENSSSCNTNKCLSSVL